MKVNHYSDPKTGKTFREIREKAENYKSLSELQKEYEKLGKKTWLTFDCDLRADYCLSIEL